MPFIEIDGISTHYQVVGDGPPLLMFSPGGFDARISKWSDLGVYKRIKLLDHLPNHFTCILFDRRENGQSGGRVEATTWPDYARQGAGLLDHLGIETAHLLGGCMGCCPVSAFAVAYPQRVRKMVLFWPVGGPNYRISSQNRFAEHADFVQAEGLSGVVTLVRSHDKNFSADPRGGPWGQPIRNSDAFARDYAALTPSDYLATLRRMLANLIDRDTAPGAEPEALMALNIPSLIIPGADNFHATSAARYLQECLSGADYWDVTPDDLTEGNANARLIAFLSDAR
jgi:pimeloyl-ACP methyl ester carboxylesterase